MNALKLLGAHYRVLGVKRETPWEQIKDAHRRLIRQFHPDRFDAADPRRAESEEKAKQINHAFQELSRSRKLQLERMQADSLTKVNFSADSPKRPRAKTVEQKIVVRNGVVYSVKKMRRSRESQPLSVKTGGIELRKKSSGRVSTLLGSLRKSAADRRELRAAAKQQAVNVADFAWSRSSDQRVVHFVEGSKLVRNGSFRS